MEFFSTTKKNEILSFASKWMKMKNIICEEIERPIISQTESRKKQEGKTCHTTTILRKGSGKIVNRNGIG
jgi:hypothetical protein